MSADAEPLRTLRREFHRYPEPSWCEFHTTSRLVDEIERIGVDELAVGRDALVADERMAVPDEETMDGWFEKARERGAREDVLAKTEGGYTGAVAVLDRGEGPHVGLRVDIDALRIAESDDAEHVPTAEGFASETGETMHACGHDAHMAIGLGVLERVAESDFEGRFTAFFQPAEEVGGGGKAMSETAYADELDYLFAVHVGLGHPTGEVVGGMVKPLAMAHVDVEYAGTSAHAGKNPEAGDNAMQAMATAIENVYGIARHADGMTRVNVGRAEAGTASNIVAEHAVLEGEVRGETTALMEYMRERFRRVVESAGDMHGCETDFEIFSESPRADSDPELAAVVCEAAESHELVESVLDEAEFGASEDATYFMRRVQEEGGLAAYAIVGTDHPTGHHSPTFDVDEETIDVGVDVLSDAILRVQ